VLGVASGALAARVADLQIVLVPVSILSLVVAHSLAHRKGAGGRGQRIALWIATPVSLALWTVPHLMR
jgi:hypothetical protein